MLPGLNTLQLHDRHATRVSTGSDGERTPRNDTNESPKRTRGRRRFTARTPPPDRAAAEARYPLGTRVRMLGQLEELRVLPDYIAATVPQGYWFFSSNESGFGTVHAVRADNFTALGTTANDTDALTIVAELEVQFANKPPEWNYMQGCGTYNCFQSGVDTQGDDSWQVALRGLLAAVNEGVGDDEFVIPPIVAVRAPKMQKAKEPDETGNSRDELVLTLYTANLGITPPVLATFPVSVLTPNGDVSYDGFGYVTEAGWTDLGDVIRSMHNTPRSDEFKERKKSIEDNVLSLLHKVSNYHLLLFDIKASNMVARRIGSKYEVRMIDFGANFTASANLHAQDDLERASDDCVFFLNGMLLLNMVLETYRRQAYFYQKLADELLDVWRRLKAAGQGKDLCSLLLRFKDQSGGWLGLPNLQRVHVDDFQDALQSTFYTMIDEYGAEDVLRRTADQRRSTEESYLGRLVEIMHKMVHDPAHRLPK